jgi:deoxycytidylate deaminase
MNHKEYFDEAAKEASKALCLRDKCGAVIVLKNKVIGRGYNAPPQDDITMRKCHLDLVESSKPKSDRTCCLHAEWRAMIDALKQDETHGGVLYLVRVTNSNELKVSDGIPYCTVCSRLALDIGLKEFILWTKDGAKVFNTKDDNEISYDFHKKSAL